MTCKHINSDGRRCRSPIVFKKDKHPADGYCYGHALSLELLSKEEVEARNKGISDKAQNKPKIKLDTTNPERYQKARVIKRKQEDLDDARRVFDSLIGTDIFDLSEMVGMAKSAGADIQEESKNLLVMWWTADTQARKPDTLAEVGELLSTNYFVLRSWLNEESFIERIKRHRLNIMELIAPQVDRTNIIKAISGDRGAIDTLYKQIGYIEVVDKEDDVFSDDDDMFEEAKEITGVDETISKTIRTRPEEDEVARNIASNFDIDSRLRDAKE